MVIFRHPAFFLFLTLSLFHALPVSAADSLHAFIYHRFGDNNYPTTNISLEDFAAQMKYLHDHGYQVVSAAKAVDLLNEGQNIPDKTVLITVDDSYSTFMSGAMPILRRYGYPVTLFVNTDSVGTAGYLDWHELRQLRDEGVEIGNHTATHRSMTDRLVGENEKDYRLRLIADIDRAQQSLVRELGIQPKLFAYPYGEYSQVAADVVERFGFSAAFAQHSGVISKEDTLFSLPRTPLTGRYATLQQMKEKLAFRPMPVRVISPLDTLVTKDNPPLLTLELLDPQLEIRKIRLFVNGEPGGIVKVDPKNPRQIIIQGSKRLEPGRSKYILTAPGRESGTFFAYTQFWLRRARP